MWRAELFRVRTGQRGPTLEFEPGSSDPSAEINGVPAGQITIRRSWLQQSGIGRMWLTPWRNGVSLQHRYNTDEPWVPVIAGPITHKPKGSRLSLPIDFKGIEEILRYRYVTHEWGHYPTTHAWLAGGFYATGSLGQIAWRALRETLTEKPNGGLPIVHGTPDEIITDDTKHVRRYPNWDLANNNLWDDVLLGLAEEDGGPDFRFTPRWAEGSIDNDIEWVFEHGTHNQPRVAHPYTIRLDETAALSPVTDLDITESGLTITHRAYGSGAGEGPGTVVRVSERLDTLAEEMPLLEAYIADTQRTTGAEVLSLAAGAVHPYEEGSWEMRCDVHTSPSLPLWQFKCGAPVAVLVSEYHAPFPAGAYNGFIRSVTWDITSDTVSLEIESGEDRNATQ